MIHSDSGFTSSSDEDDEDFVPSSGAKKRPGLSLKARAVSLLSRREYSRVELARKLTAHADSKEELEALLDTLTREGWQSDERVIQSVVHRKSPIHGSLRITQELKQKGLTDAQVSEMRMQLKDTELERARGVWDKKFGSKGGVQTPNDYAKQARFLAARGFSHDIVRQVLKAALAGSPQDNLDEDSI